YAQLWQGRAALTRILEGRSRFLRATADPPTRQKVEALLEVRRQLATLLLAPADLKDKDRAGRLQDLAQLKEEQQRELAGTVPELDRKKARLTAPYTDLVRALPPRSAFLDLYHYWPWPQVMQEIQGSGILKVEPSSGMGGSAMRGRKPRPLVIAASDLPILRAVARARHLAWFQVQHARIVLAVAAGEPIHSVASRMECDPS